MTSSGENRSPIATLGYLMILLIVFLMVASPSAAAQEITAVEGTEIIDTPTKTKGSITIDSAAIHPSTNTETITIEFNNYRKIYPNKVYLQNFSNGVLDNKTVSKQIKFENLNIERPGTYWIYYSDEDFNDYLYPITVPGYELSTSNFPNEVTKDEEMSFELSISKKDLSHYDGEISDVDKIRVEVWKNDESVTFYESSFSGFDNKYQVSGDVSDLDSADYNVYVTALGSEKKVLGSPAPEPLAVADLGSVSITDSNDDDSGDDNNEDESDDEDSGGSGGQGGGGAAGGQGTGDSTTDSGPPTPQNVRDTLSLVDPTSEATINEDSSSTGAEENEGSDESQSSGNSESSVSAVEFEGETQHSVSVTDYGTPPQTVEEEVIDSIAAYNSGVNPATDSGSNSAESTDSDSETDESGSTADDGDSDVIEPNSSPSDSSDGSGDTDDGSDIRVVSLSDISPTEEIDDEETTATVTFSVDRNEVTNPNQLTVYKEEYVFEAQEEQWIELETSVSETTGEEVEVTAETTEFSLFAVTETISEQSQPSGSNNETATSSQNNSTGTTDQTPGFGITSVLLAILTVIGLSRHRK